MARSESRVKMGFLPISEHHHEAILSLVERGSPRQRLLDPFAGEGEFLSVASEAWNMTPYANELDGERARQCIERFGSLQAVRSDALRLRASNNAFALLWCNPPYDIDKSASGSKRVEFAMLRHVWKWAMRGGLVFWVVYRHHITEEAASFLAKNSSQVDVWGLPGKHLGEYDQIIVVATKGHAVNAEAMYASILAQKEAMQTLEIQTAPVYKLPAPEKKRQFIFTSDMIDSEIGLGLSQQYGAWQMEGFQSLLEIPEKAKDIEPVVAPRPGHMALILAAGVANGAVIETEDYGSVAIRGKTKHVESISRVDIESDPKDADRQIKKTIIKLKPTTTLTLLGADGRQIEMNGDDALLDFIRNNRTALASYLNTKFKPMYDFKLNGLSPFLGRVRLNGKYPLYDAQKHVVAAITRGFESRKGILLSGQMGVGKTAIGSSVAIGIASGAVKALRDKIGADQVILCVCPPHLIDKWKRELLSINPNMIVEHLRRHEDVKAFMDKASRIGAGIPKIALIKRDMTKLGAGYEPMVVWRNKPIILWQKHQPVPEGYEEQERIIKKSVACCAHCGIEITYERKGTIVAATKTWLKAGKRSCSNCHSPLWQEARDRGSRPRKGEKYPRKNPRYRLDQYLQKKYPERVYLLIWDEVHEAANGDTGNGVAFGRMAGLAKKVLALTGTPFNGRSSSLFNLEYHLNERIAQEYPIGGSMRFGSKAKGSPNFQTRLDGVAQRGRAESRWVSKMGVRERVLEERPSYDKESGAYTGTSTYERPYTEAPGISPLLVAEMLDHTVFFSLADLGKYLPRYEEIALPVKLDEDIGNQYDITRNLLKDYLIQRRWEGDLTFRGAYLQWILGWVNATFRPTDVIHNLRHPVSNEKIPHVVTRLPSYGEDRIYAKEQALIELLTEELANNRPCVIYLRQTATKDIQPRIERLIRQHVEGAVPYILKNTVSAEKREKVLNEQVANGCNILICNPELVKTGIDLLAYPSLIYYEIVFNLSTMMQASARSFRLNQTADLCKVIYMFAEGTMEQTAVQLMSRKQRAAKLLTGDIGLTGLEALTEGEGGLEAALLDAIAKDDSLVDPREMFQTKADDSIDIEDANFWQVETAEEADVPETLLEEAISLGGVLREEITSEANELARKVIPNHIEAESTAQMKRRVHSYLKSVSIVFDMGKRIALQAELIVSLLNGVFRDDETRAVMGMLDETFPKYENHNKTLVKWVKSWMRKKQFVFREFEEEVAVKVVEISRQALGYDDLKQDIFEALQDMKDKERQEKAKVARPELRILPKPSKKVRKAKKVLDLMAIPEDEPADQDKATVSAKQDKVVAQKQMAMF